MEKGQICRRMSNDGTPIGPYMIIKNFLNGGTVELERCCVDKPSHYTVHLLKGHVKECKIRRIVISDTIWERIRDGKQSAIIHEATKVWSDLQNIKPELVQLRSIKYSQKVMVFTVQQIRDNYYTGMHTRRPHKEIRLELGYRIV